ncbi:hypothetical protein C6T59_25160 [Burkholderia multivorans]|nr:hypothetical protein C6Q01_04390 [Burkholderia multivorans]PRG61450.1 hypothetical protein C6T59_25160 [Burkholderia multivorans]
MCLGACLPACLLACLPACLLACLPACLLACLRQQASCIEKPPLVFICTARAPHNASHGHRATHQPDRPVIRRTISTFKARPTTRAAHRPARPPARAAHARSPVRPRAFA